MLFFPLFFPISNRAHAFCPCRAIVLLHFFCHTKEITCRLLCFQPGCKPIPFSCPRQQPLEVLPSSPDLVRQGFFNCLGNPSPFNLGNEGWSLASPGLGASKASFCFPTILRRDFQVKPGSEWVLEESAPCNVGGMAGKWASASSRALADLVPIDSPILITAVN